MTEFFALLEARRSGQPAPAPEQHAAATPATPIAQEAVRAVRMATLAGTGLFDAAYYLAAYPDIAAAGVEPFEHFFDHGWNEGRRPNPYFDPLWYAAQNPDVTQGGLNPLFHYAFHGDAEGRRAAPAVRPRLVPRALRDARPGRSRWRIGWRTAPAGRFSPMPEFDVAFYLTHSPDVAAAGVDPFEHFWGYGYREGRNPSEEFDVRFYAQRYLRGDLTENPFGHWLAHRARARASSAACRRARPPSRGR